MIEPVPAAESDFAARLAAKAARDQAEEAASQVANFEPISDRCLVQRVTAPEEVKIGSIVVPTAAREKPLEAVVLAVGPGKLTDNGVRHPFAFSVGDTILIGRYSGTEVTLDNKEYLILNESEVFGILRRANS